MRAPDLARLLQLTAIKVVLKEGRIKMREREDERVPFNAFFTEYVLSLLLTIYGVPTTGVKGDTPVHCLGLCSR